MGKGPRTIRLCPPSTQCHAPSSSVSQPLSRQAVGGCVNAFPLSPSDWQPGQAPRLPTWPCLGISTLLMLLVPLLQVRPPLGSLAPPLPAVVRVSPRLSRAHLWFVSPFCLFLVFSAPLSPRLGCDSSCLFSAGYLQVSWGLVSGAQWGDAGVVGKLAGPGGS